MWKNQTLRRSCSLCRQGGNIVKLLKADRQFTGLSKVVNRADLELDAASTALGRKIWFSRADKHW